MEDEILPELENEITRNPLRFEHAHRLMDRATELKEYDDFFGVIDIEELDNVDDIFFDGFM